MESHAFTELTFQVAIFMQELFPNMELYLVPRIGTMYHEKPCGSSLDALYVDSGNEILRQRLRFAHGTRWLPPHNGASRPK